MAKIAAGSAKRDIKLLLFFVLVLFFQVQVRQVLWLLDFKMCNELESLHYIYYFCLV